MIDMDAKLNNIEDMYVWVSEMVKNRKPSPYRFQIQDPMPRMGREPTDEDKERINKTFARVLELSKQYKVDFKLK